MRNEKLKVENTTGSAGVTMRGAMKQTLESISAHALCKEVLISVSGPHECLLIYF